MKEWASLQEFKIKRHQFDAETIESIIQETKLLTNIEDFYVKTIERSTESGFYMNLHRDEYRFDLNAFKRGVRDETLWIPIYDKTSRPTYTALWYHSTQGVDFTGGNLKFHDNQTFKPYLNNVVLFDSNDLHEVTLQQTKENLTNERKVSIIKFYEKH